MDTVSSNTVRALAFCFSTAAIKSRVHFFPSAGVTSGPYSISCMLTLFGKGVERRSVMLDGGRLGQPDGVRLEDAFPSLRGEASGLFGLEIQLSCSQGRVNLRASQAAVELVSPQFSALYSVAAFRHADEEPQAVENEEEQSLTHGPSSAMGIAVQESDVTSSLVMINAGAEVVKPELFRKALGREVPIHVGTLAPESSIEVPLDEALFKESSPHECIFGLLRAESLSLGARARRSDTEYYLVYRNPETKRPISVVAL
jgi:hypothetical protein